MSKLVDGTVHNCCVRCGGTVRGIADASDRCIEDQDITEVESMVEPDSVGNYVGGGPSRNR